MSIPNCGLGLPLPLSVSGEQTADLVRRAMSKYLDIIVEQQRMIDRVQRVGLADHGMTHNLSSHGHLHSVTDPEHTHSIIDPGHKHTFWETVYDRFGNAVPGIRSTYHTKAPFVPAPIAPAQPATATAVAPSTAKPPLPARALTGRPMQIGIFVR